MIWCRYRYVWHISSETTLGKPEAVAGSNAGHRSGGERQCYWKPQALSAISQGRQLNQPWYIGWAHHGAGIFSWPSHCITCRVLDNSLVGAAFGFCLFVLFFRGSQLSHMLYMAGAIFDEPLVPFYVAGAVFGELLLWFFVAGAVFGELLFRFFVAGAVVGEPLVPFFVAATVFGEPLVRFFVAGAVFGELLGPCFVAGARNLKLQVAKRVGKR